MVINSIWLMRHLRLISLSSAALTQKIPQMNNFVIYDGFFASQESQRDGSSAQMHITAR
jgi:hypothetical protein